MLSFHLDGIFIMLKLQGICWFYCFINRNIFTIIQICHYFQKALLSVIIADIRQIIIMLKQTLISKMSHREQCNQNENTIPNPQQTIQETNSVNLFVLQASHNQAMASLRSKSSKKFRLFKKKTPSDIIKDSIMKNRQNKRINSLKSITSENLKLFMRLQQQRSSYKFAELHKQLSCSVLPLAKSHITNRSNNKNGQDGSSVRTIFRCSSATSTLKSRCASLKSFIKPEHSTSQLKCEPATHIAASRALSKLSIENQRQEKENMVGNRPSSNLRLCPQDEQALIMKKIGVKVPIDRQRIFNNRQRISQNIVNRHFASNNQLKKVQKPPGILSQRKIESNLPL